MVWHGTERTKAGLAELSEDQRLQLAKLAKDNDYWAKVKGFVDSVHGRYMGSLSVKQAEWFLDIEAQLEVEVNRREGRIAFGVEKEDE